MTTAAIMQQERTNSISIMAFVGIGLALLMLAGYYIFPWIHQPELGDTTVRVLTASRDNNEYEIMTNGLILIPFAGFGALILGIWSAFRPHQARTTGVLTVVAGIAALVYYVNFFRDLSELETDVMSFMRPGFWLVLAAGIGMILYGLVPRARVKGYEIRRVLGNQETVLIMGFIFLLVTVGVSNPRYLAERNISDVLQGNAYVAVAAIGMSMVIISGNIDISVGSLIGVLATISGAIAIDDRFPLWFAWVAPLIFGGLVGALIGFMVAYLKIPSIIVTLGMLSILKGGLISVTNGEWISDMPQAYFLAQQRPLGIPVPIWAMLVFTFLAALWMNYTTTGRSIYAVGGNAEAARLSGISPRRVVMTVFIINGVFVGISSVLFATQLSIIQSTVPPGLELLIITAAVVGGVSILGGTGTVIGAIVAAVLLNAIRAAMVFINISPFWLQAVQGLLILITVLADLLRRRRQIS